MTISAIIFDLGCVVFDCTFDKTFKAWATVTGRHADEKGWNAIYLDTIADIDNLLQDLKKNYRLVALTNTNIIHSKIWTEKYADTLRHFEKVFSSHEIGTRKPEIKAFQTVLDYLKLSPPQTVFLDDKEEYISGARQLGMNTILVISYDQMLQGLENFGIQNEHGQN